MRPLPPGRALLLVTPELFVEFLKRNGPPRRLEVVEHGLPEDTALVGVRWDGSQQCVLLELASAEFPLPDDAQWLLQLPPPRLQINESDLLPARLMIQRFALQPGDVIVVRVDTRLPDDTVAYLTARLQSIIPPRGQLVFVPAGVDVELQPHIGREGL